MQPRDKYRTQVFIEILRLSPSKRGEARPELSNNGEMGEILTSVEIIESVVDLSDLFQPKYYYLFMSDNMAFSSQTVLMCSGCENHSESSKNQGENLRQKIF
jgi:hypothetical protein